MAVFGARTGSCFKFPRGLYGIGGSSELHGQDYIFSPLARLLDWHDHKTKERLVHAFYRSSGVDCI